MSFVQWFQQPIVWGFIALFVLGFALFSWLFWWGFHKRMPEPLESPMEQQRLGDEELAAWEKSMQGKSFIFGEWRAAAQRVQNKYPSWRSSPEAGMLIGPDRAEYL